MSSIKKPKKKLDLGRELLRIGHLRFEKCELKEAEQSFEQALTVGRRHGDHYVVTESIVGLLRTNGEALNKLGMDRWEKELNDLISEFTEKQHSVPACAWYSKGALATYQENWRLAQRHFHRFLKATRRESLEAGGTASKAGETSDDRAGIARAILMLANASQQRGHYRRSRWLVEVVLRNYEPERLKGINGVAYLLLGQNSERRGKSMDALGFYQKAHAAFLAEHNWYHHLYVLLGYARIARLQQNYTQAYFYLDLIRKAASSNEFGILQHELKRERTRLESSAVDLLIDSQKGLVQTRDGGKISIRKQYVLLDILKALCSAHNRGADQVDRGLSKAEIIETVWKENYRPEAHDNKLYYNINRLRKLIEPNFRQPKYLLNWKEGYRLAPGLRVQLKEGNQIQPGMSGIAQLGADGGNRK